MIVAVIVSRIYLSIVCARFGGNSIAMVKKIIKVEKCWANHRISKRMIWFSPKWGVIVHGPRGLQQSKNVQRRFISSARTNRKTLTNCFLLFLFLIFSIVCTEYVWNVPFILFSVEEFQSLVWRTQSTLIQFNQLSTKIFIRRDTKKPSKNS